MSSACVDLLLYEIQNNFGKDCKNICQILLFNEWSTVKEIKNELKYLKSKQILECLQHLVDFNLVLFNFDGDVIDTYQFDIDSAMSFLLLDSYLIIIENKFGNLNKTIFEMFCEYGNLFSTQLFEKVQKYVNADNWIDLVVDATNHMIRKEILEVTPMNLINCKTLTKNAIITEVDQIKKELLHPSGKLGVKRTFAEIDRRWDIQLRINYAKFNILLRNEIIVNDSLLTVGEEAAFVLKRFIDSFEDGAKDCYNEPMSLSLLCKIIRKENKEFDDDKIKECVYLLSTNDSVSYIEERSNNGVVLLYFNPKIVVKQLVIKIISDIVQVIFEDNGLRIFSFVLNNPYIEENAFRNSVIMSTNQINELLPSMISKGFISRFELSKTKQYFDEPLVSLFHVDIGKIARNERETCYQSLYRLMVRRNHEELKNETLVKKLHDMSTKDKNIPDNEENPIKVITELDEEAIARLNKALHKLDCMQISINTSFVLFDTFIQQQNNNENY